METKNTLEELMERKEAETEAPLMSTASNQENMMSTRMPMDKETPKPQLDNEHPLSSTENILGISTNGNQGNTVSTMMAFDEETPKPQLDDDLSSAELHLHKHGWESKKIIKQEDIISKENADDQPKTVDETPDSSQTMFENNDGSSEGVVSSKDNAVTESVVKMTTVSRGDNMELITMGFDPASLESGSSVLDTTVNYIPPGDYLNGEDNVTNNVFDENSEDNVTSNVLDQNVEENVTSKVFDQNIEENVTNNVYDQNIEDNVTNNVFDQNIEENVTNNVFDQNTVSQVETSTSGLIVKDAMDQVKEATSSSSKENLKENVNGRSDNDTGLIVKLLPESQTLSPDQEEDSKLIHEDLQQITANINKENKGSKSLPVTEDLNHLEDIVTSELEPPKSRRKHRNPPTFECRR